MCAKKLTARYGASAAVIAAVAAVVLAAAAVALAPAAIASAAAGTKVTVRIEGTKRTLLATSAVQTHGGWITTGRTPRGACPATSAAGALDVATHHRWDGTYDASLGLEVVSILGERHTFSSRRFFWEIFVDNRPATGACLQKLHRGDQLLFAAVSQKTIAYPIAVRAPQHATVGHPFTVKVVWFNAKGIAKPLAGARVTVAGHTMTTTSRGTVQITPASPGALVIKADRENYVRAASVRVSVSG
jgi:hypothetical protein